MIFIAFFGIQDKEKDLGTKNNIVCPACGKLARYEIYKFYRYFHLFFIPIFRWNIKYMVKSSCCGCLYELDSLVGKNFENNPATDIREENLHPVNNYYPFKYCSNCKTDIPAEFHYCPYCGGKV
ncbi:MAG TPA: zinc ribbon domain-containing protein [Clostridiales bacterium]|jgi:hypothetical protein|nr:zinc ribbon domain-containing protein [Clostridiales bacterium]